MALQLEIERLHIDAPGTAYGDAELFRSLLKRALQEELQHVLITGQVDTHQVLRVDMPPITVSDIYDMEETASEIARRIVQAIRRDFSRE
jgi:hypothetical protein